MIIGHDSAHPKTVTPSGCACRCVDLLSPEAFEATQHSDTPRVRRSWGKPTSLTFLVNAGRIVAWRFLLPTAIAFERTPPGDPQKTLRRSALVAT